MKILVTGANGQVGSELKYSVLAKKLGIEIIACSREALDISSIDSVKSVLQREKPTAVINAAAYTAVDKAEEEVELAYAINEIGPKNLALACEELDIPLIHISTDYVFDGNKEGLYNEDDLAAPTGEYGKSKLAGEIAVTKLCQKHLILRVSWVFGEYGNNFVKTMLRLAENRDALNIVADQQGAPTWAKDIADTALLMAKNACVNNAKYGVYHYSGDEQTNWYDFAQAIFQNALIIGNLAKAPALTAITTTEYPTPAKRPLNSKLNCEKIKTELGISQSDWQAGLTHVLEKWK